MPEPEQQRRAQRILDAAADLVLRWGYKRVTVEEVAKRAGIGKGTVYLHFRNKEALFLTVLLRAQHQVVEATAERMAADPEQLLPSRLVSSLYRVLSDDPLARVLYLGDAEVLGRLAHEAADTLGALVGRRQEVLTEHLRLLHAAGCLRSDLRPEALLYMFSAIGAGFFLMGGMPGGTPDLDVETRTDLLERAVAATMEVPDPPAVELERLAPVVAELYRSLIKDIDHEVQRRVR